MQQIVEIHNENHRQGQRGLLDIEPGQPIGRRASIALTLAGLLLVLRGDTPPAITGKGGAGNELPEATARKQLSEAGDSRVPFMPRIEGREDLWPRFPYQRQHPDWTTDTNIPMRQYNAAHGVTEYLPEAEPIHNYELTRDFIPWRSDPERNKSAYDEAGEGEPEFSLWDLAVQHESALDCRTYEHTHTGDLLMAVPNWDPEAEVEFVRVGEPPQTRNTVLEDGTTVHELPTKDAMPIVTLPGGGLLYMIDYEVFYYNNDTHRSERASDDFAWRYFQAVDEALGLGVLEGSESISVR